MISYPKGSEIEFTSTGKLPGFELCFELPGAEKELWFQCDARHMRDTGKGIQVGVAFRNTDRDDLKKLGAYIM